ncbi:MAG: single-stranded-DNA-specific exonuclease RecJ, partial [Alphaproteobacteria bacterium]
MTQAREGAFLGVDRSLTGRAWRSRPGDALTARGFELQLGLSQPLALALASRGVRPDGGETYLRPSLRVQFPDPSSFMDMDKAARLLVDAAERQRAVAVFADYDVDGASSAAQLIRWFRSLGVELTLYVPDRITEGYGPSPLAFRRLKDQGIDLVVTVDCGAMAHDAILAAGEMGLEVVVIDHHTMREDPPAAAAVVNPNRPGCNSGQGMLAAAGVTFVLLAALNREARRRSLFSEDRPEPDIRQWLDLAAMGAICDVTQLVEFNRALTFHGLKRMSGWNNIGLAALMEAANSPLIAASVFHAGFVLGPRINAGGRIGRADLGARLLSTDDPAEAKDLAAQLNTLNAERREVEQQLFEDAVAMLEGSSNFNPNQSVIVAAGEGWHPGVIGIVASRLRERYRKPAVVIGIDTAADAAKGSGRSQPGVNLGGAI